MNIKVSLIPLPILQHENIADTTIDKTKVSLIVLIISISLFNINNLEDKPNFSLHKSNRTKVKVKKISMDRVSLAKS